MLPRPRRARRTGARATDACAGRRSDVLKIITDSRRRRSTVAYTPPRNQSRSAQLALLLFAGVSLACSVQAEEFSSVESSGSVHAVLRVRRVEMLDSSAV